MPKINCMECNIEHNVLQREINRGNGKFCSRKCTNVYRANNLPTPQPNVKCAFCEENFYLNPSKQNGSKSGLFFCCRQHKDEAQRVGGISEIQPSHYGTGMPENTYLRIAFAVKPKQCERCGYNKHEAAIIVHHIDRDRSNNNILNLEVLCSNCHAIEHWADLDKN